MGLFDGLKKNKEDASLTNYRKTGLNTNLSNYGWYECVEKVISILIIFFRKAEVEEINRKIYSAYVNIVIAQREMT